MPTTAVTKTADNLKVGDYIAWSPEDLLVTWVENNLNGSVYIEVGHHSSDDFRKATLPETTKVVVRG